MKSLQLINRMGIYLMILVLSMSVACVKQRKPDKSFRILVNTAVKQAIRKLPDDVFKPEDKVVVVALELGHGYKNREYFHMVKQGILSGVSTRALCQERTITKLIKSPDTTRSPLDETATKSLVNDLNATKILAYRPLKYTYLAQQNLLKTKLYIRIIELEKKDNESVLPKVIWSGVVDGVSKQLNESDRIRLKENDYDLHVQVHDATKNAIQKVFGNVGFSDIFLQPLGDDTAYFSGINAINVQKQRIFRNLNRSLTTNRGGKNRDPINIDKIFIAVEEGLTTAFTQKTKGAVIEKIKIPFYRFIDQYKILTYYSNPIQFFSWPLLREQTNANYMLSYRILQIESAEITTVRIYIRLTSLYSGKITWSGIVTGESGTHSKAFSKKYLKRLNSLSYFKLHNMAFKVMSHIPLTPFANSDNVVVVNGSQNVRDMQYDATRYNTLALEDGVISGLSDRLRAKSKASVIDKIQSVYVQQDPTAYYLTSEYLEQLRKQYNKLTKLVTYEVLQVNYTDGTYDVTTPVNYLLNKQIEDLQLEVNVIDVKKGALIYSNIMSSK